MPAVVRPSLMKTEATQLSMHTSINTVYKLKNIKFISTDSMSRANSVLARKLAG